MGDDFSVDGALARFRERRGQLDSPSHRKADAILQRIAATGRVTSIDRARVRVLTEPGHRLEAAGVGLAVSIPYILVFANIVAVLVMLLLDWLPKGQVPYTWLTIAGPLLVGVLATGYHFVVNSPVDVKVTSVASVVVMLALLGLAIRYPQDKCCAAVRQGSQCPPPPAPPAAARPAVATLPAPPRPAPPLPAPNTPPSPMHQAFPGSLTTEPW